MRWDDSEYQTTTWWGWERGDELMRLGSSFHCGPPAWRTRELRRLRRPRLATSCWWEWSARGSLEWSSSGKGWHFKNIYNPEFSIIRSETDPAYETKENRAKRPRETNQKYYFFREWQNLGLCYYLVKVKPSSTKYYWFDFKSISLGQSLVKAERHNLKF